MMHRARTLAAKAAPTPREAASPTGLAGFAACAGRSTSLAELGTAFAAAIAIEGFDGHLCLVLPEGLGPSALFGDLDHVPAEALRAVQAQPPHPRPIADRGDCGLLVPVQGWDADPLFLYLSAGAGTLERDRIARVQGLCEVYATYGYALFEQQQDIATNVGLGLCQRQCLALILTGHRDYEIAEMLQITPLSVRGHIHHAMARLDADSRAEAVAIAARRGWLIGREPGQAIHLPRN